MSALRRVHGGAAVRNGRLLVLVHGGGDQPMKPAVSGSDAPRHLVARELGGFLAAVFVGSLGGLLLGQLLATRMGAGAAGNLAIAAGTTLTAATHARLIHGLGVRALLPRVLVAAPLAYFVMRGVHGLLGR